ncbi:MAG: leucyl aminopeptidase [Rickettsiales bacterium]|nr:leucyl aminopeptidase [Rickettsiales bacterium]RPG16268.1 MAG: leucyl aminopeptidase family protein [Pelagibacteraceae bacterium TMED195]|tara:strand:+ start:560 stop:1906 length:1347 start_codon:yes stop_codon:yes gene_type:complete
MTSKSAQFKKKAICIYFFKNQIPQEFKKKTFDEFASYSVLKKDDSIHLNLEKISKLNILQKNYKLLLIGQAISKYCKSGDFFIDYYGCKETNIKSFLLGWNLANYSFNKFQSKKLQKKIPKIFHESNNEIDLLTESYFFVRDLINTPANILGPKEIFNEAKKFLKKFTLTNYVVGKKLEKNFPLISAVGQGADVSKKPIFCEFKFNKKKSKKKVFLIGKGVSFDTGGLNIKTGSGMSLMKKDMGGAANCIGLAKLISDFNLDVDLRLLLCLVENSVSKKSIRPSDIIKSRKGSFVEIGDTDAEGRLILADAISYACEKNANLIIDMATLTGASRVAMGTEVPSFFCNDDYLAMKLIDLSQKTGDPLWQLPLWENYSGQLNSAHADFKNIGNSMFGGAITAALFLQKFVKDVPWIHVDLMAWTRANKFCSYEGGEAMGMRALLELIKKI